jgi:hypothetical protein
MSGDGEVPATALAAWITFGGSISQKKAAKGNKVERSFVGPDGELMREGEGARTGGRAR